MKSSTPGHARIFAQAPAQSQTRERRDCSPKKPSAAPGAGARGHDDDNNEERERELELQAQIDNLSRLLDDRPSASLHSRSGLSRTHSLHLDDLTLPVPAQPSRHNPSPRTARRTVAVPVESVYVGHRGSQRGGSAGRKKVYGSKAAPGLSTVGEVVGSVGRPRTASLTRSVATTARPLPHPVKLKRTAQPTPPMRYFPASAPPPPHTHQSPRAANRSKVHPFPDQPPHPNRTALTPLTNQPHVPFPTPSPVAQGKTHQRETVIHRKMSLSDLLAEPASQQVAGAFPTEQPETVAQKDAYLTRLMEHSRRIKCEVDRLRTNTARLTRTPSGTPPRALPGDAGGVKPVSKAELKGQLQALLAIASESDAADPPRQPARQTPPPWGSGPEGILGGSPNAPARLFEPTPYASSSQPDRCCESSAWDQPQAGEARAGSPSYCGPGAGSPPASQPPPAAAAAAAERRAGDAAGTRAGGARHEWSAWDQPQAGEARVASPSYCGPGAGSPPASQPPPAAAAAAAERRAGDAAGKRAGGERHEWSAWDQPQAGDGPGPGAAFPPAPQPPPAAAPAAAAAAERRPTDAAGHRAGDEHAVHAAAVREPARLFEPAPYASSPQPDVCGGWPSQGHPQAGEVRAGSPSYYGPPPSEETGYAGAKQSFTPSTSPSLPDARLPMPPGSVSSATPRVGGTDACGGASVPALSRSPEASRILRDHGSLGSPPRDGSEEAWVCAGDRVDETSFLDVSNSPGVHQRRARDEKAANLLLSFDTLPSDSDVTDLLVQRNRLLADQQQTLSQLRLLDDILQRKQVPQTTPVRLQYDETELSHQILQTPEPSFHPHPNHQQQSRQPGDDEPQTPGNVSEANITFTLSPQQYSPA
eukprot:gene20679-31866_t